MVFKEGEFCCPACKRDFDAADIDIKKNELTTNFNTDKSEKLSVLQKRGTELGTEITDLETKLGNITAKGETLKSELQVISDRITELETEVQALKTKRSVN